MYSSLRRHELYHARLPCPFNAEEAEIDQFSEGLQDFLELKPKKKKNVLFNIGDWNTKVGHQETLGEASLTLKYKMEQSKG